MNKKLLSLIALAGLFASVGCTPSNNSTGTSSTPTNNSSSVEKYSSTVLENTENTYVLHGMNIVDGKENGWNGKADDLYKATTMTPTSVKAISEISTELADTLNTKNLNHLYVLENVEFGTRDAGYTKPTMIEGKRYLVNGSYTFKVTEVSYDAEDEVYAELKWLPDPHKYHVESLTPTTYYAPVWQEALDDNGFSWASDPSCIGGAGTYTVVLAAYKEISTAEVPGYGVALIKTADGVAATEDVQEDYSAPATEPEAPAWVAADHTYGIIGSFNSWNGDIAMTETDGVWSAEVTLDADSQIKVRADGAWDVSWGAESVVEPEAMKGTGNILVADAGTYTVSISNFTADAKAEVRVAKVA